MSDRLSKAEDWACPWTIAGPAWIIKMGCGMCAKSGCYCDRSLNNELLASVWRNRNGAETFIRHLRAEMGETSLRAVPMPMAFRLPMASKRQSQAKAPDLDIASVIAAGARRGGSAGVERWRKSG